MKYDVTIISEIIFFDFTAKLSACLILKDQVCGHLERMPTNAYYKTYTGSADTPQAKNLFNF